MSELEQYITNYFGIPTQAVEHIQSRFSHTSLKKGGSYAHEGKHITQLSFIKSGLLRVFKHDEKKEVTQWISSPGEFITDLSSLIFQQPARWNIEALTDCEFFTIGIDQYKTIHEVIPEWSHLEKLFIAKCFVSLEDRIHQFISMSAEERYLHFLEQKGNLINEVPHHFLASMLGMTPETLSRIRRKITS